VSLAGAEDFVARLSVLNSARGQLTGGTAGAAAVPAPGAIQQSGFITLLYRNYCSRPGREMIANLEILSGASGISCSEIAWLVSLSLEAGTNLMKFGLPDNRKFRIMR